LRVSSRSTRRAVAAAAAAALLAPAAAVVGTVAAPGVAHAADQLPVPVIVRYGDGDPAAAALAVTRAGGTVGQSLAVADAFAATVPADAVARIAASPAVAAVTPNGRVSLNADSWTADTTLTPMSAVNTLTGATTTWTKRDATGRTLTGKGIGVALIDSGISPVRGISTTRLVHGPDLSINSPSPTLRRLDLFGHGTHMAGIIAGRDPDVAAGAENDPTRFVGVAPDATLVNVKVAADDGAVDVSQVLAAIDWTVIHRNDTGLNVRVLNLSFGTDSVQDARLDPLAFAVEAAWKKGIVVVVAAGNDGAAATRLGMPAMNPYVIAVGGSDHRGTAQPNDDVVADFSSRGSAARHADLVAPGQSVASLRTPNSYVDTFHPAGRLSLAADPTQRYVRGSGTSQSAAVVSGAAALLLQQRPELTPDQVKRLLTTTARPLTTADTIAQGAGQLNIAAAVAAATPAYTQSVLPALGTGTLEKSRGTTRLTDMATGGQLTGERDLMGRPFVSSTWASKVTAGNAWSGGSWNGGAWAGGGWQGTVAGTPKTWSSAAWSSSWTGQEWTVLGSPPVWDGKSWSSDTWTSRTWASRTWASRTWASRTWAAGYWKAERWK